MTVYDKLPVIDSFSTSLGLLKRDFFKLLPLWVPYLLIAILGGILNLYEENQQNLALQLPLFITALLFFSFASCETHRVVARDGDMPEMTGVIGRTFRFLGRQIMLLLHVLLRSLPMFSILGIAAFVGQGYSEAGGYPPSAGTLVALGVIGFIAVLVPLYYSIQLSPMLPAQALEAEDKSAKGILRMTFGNFWRIATLYSLAPFILFIAYFASLLVSPLAFGILYLLTLLPMMMLVVIQANVVYQELSTSKY